jgi:Cd2+/Zn2+-exporting ATPase
LSNCSIVNQSALILLLLLEISKVSQAHVKKLDLRVSNLDCEHDAAAIQRGLADFSGLDDLKVYPKSAKVAVTYDPTVTSPETLKEKLETLGFPPQTGLSMPEQPKPWRNPKVLTSVASGALLLIGWLIGLAGAPEIVSFIFYIAAILIGGYYFGREAIEGLVFERKIGIELLMTIAAIVATVMGNPLSSKSVDGPGPQSGSGATQWPRNGSSGRRRDRG